MSLSSKEQLQKAQEVFLQQTPADAFQHLRFVLQYPNLEVENSHEKEAFTLFAKIGEQIAGKEFAEKVWMAIHHPDVPKVLYSLGYELIEQQLPGIAATVLARAHRLAPDHESILTELSIALEDSGQHFAAYLFLKKAEKLIQTRFFCRYLLAFNALMIPKVEEAAALMDGLEQLCQQEQTTEHLFMLTQLKQMLKRAEEIKKVTSLDTEDLRGWHFVVTGGVLLHLSPYGFDEGMHGRYAFTQDSLTRCKESCLRVQAILEETHIRPPQIFLLPDRDSTILGLALSQILQIPCKAWPQQGTEEAGLIVAYDLNQVEETMFHSLENHKPGQILFCHAAQWTERQPIVGDLTMYLYQMNQTPWGERFSYGSGENEMTKHPPMTESAEELAQQIVTSQVTEEDLADLPILRKLIRGIAQFQGPEAAGLFCSSGHRRRQRTDSPVKSNRF